MALAIILFAVTIYEHVGNHNIAAPVLCALGVVFFCFGAYWAWSKERDKFETEVTKNGNPNFELTLGQIQYEYNADFNLTTLLIPCTITNHGATSHAIGWQAHLRHPSGVEGVQTVHFPEQTYYWDLGNGKVLPLHKEKMLPALTIEAVESKCSKSGRLLFQFSGDIRNSLIFNAATLHVGCVDRLNRIFWRQFGPAYPSSEIVTLPDEQIIDVSDYEVPRLPE